MPKMTVIEGRLSEVPEGRERWTELEQRLAASLLYRSLAVRAHPHEDLRVDLMERLNMPASLILKAIVWMRTNHVQIRVVWLPNEGSLVRLRVGPSRPDRNDGCDECAIDPWGPDPRGVVEADTDASAEPRARAR